MYGTTRRGKFWCSEMPQRELKEERHEMALTWWREEMKKRRRREGEVFVSSTTESLWVSRTGIYTCGRSHARCSCSEVYLVQRSQGADPRRWSGQTMCDVWPPLTTVPKSFWHKSCGNVGSRCESALRRSGCGIVVRNAHLIRPSLWSKLYRIVVWNERYRTTLARKSSYQALR